MSDPDIEKAITKLREAGYKVDSRIQGGKLWFEIDGRMLATMQEMRELGAGVYTLAELEELMTKRRAEEQE